MLWLALHFPLLPLEVRTRGRIPADDPTPIAIEDGRHIGFCDPVAHAAGVQPGMGIDAARALIPNLRVLPRRPDDEVRALHALAAWALQFTPQLSLHGERGLLLEIGASLRLFDGLDALLTRVERGVPQLGYRLHDAVAPTPAAAWFGARLGVTLRIETPAALARGLAGLDLACLELDPRREARLRGMGLHRLGQVFTLPRAGLAQRIGKDALAHIDRALGRQPDPRPAWQPPTRFASAVELPIEVDGGAPLRFALHRLLRELGGYLRGRDAGAGRLRLGFHHREHAPTPLTLNLLTPSREVDHLDALLQTRLERLALPAPVTAIDLACDDVRPFETRADDLFGDRRSADKALPALIERLRARLGDDRVHGLDARTEHRPERAWQTPEPIVRRGPDAAGHAGRPLWLLPEPRPIDPGRLRRLTGPERIATGWWDGAPISRDYVVAQAPDGRRLWLYRDRTDRRWHLHGLFA